MNNISLDILKLDADKSNRIDARELYKILERRVVLPEYLKQNQEHLDQFVSEYVDQNTGKVAYRDLIEDLRTFDYDKATNDKSNNVQSYRSSAQSDIIN